MKYLSFIGKHLKDEEMLEWLGDWDAVVIYHFDRDHQNLPDYYEVSFRSDGVELHFNAKQSLSTIFLYIEPRGHFEAIDPTEMEDVRIFRNVDDVVVYCVTNGFPFKKGGTPDRSWARIDESNLSIHYEFMKDSLSLITVMDANCRVG